MPLIRIKNNKDLGQRQPINNAIATTAGEAGLH